MYKLVMVDDKKDVTEGIIRMGNWSELGFQVVGKAYNGQEALKIIQDTEPDIVITDIRMPMMDGIELTERIKNQYPLTKVIILSGYDDFNYAQQAVKLGAEEYLLKPARIQEIVRAVLRAKKKLDQERKKKQEQILLRQKLTQSLPLLKDEYFQYLISHHSELENQEQIKEKFNFLDIQLDLGHIVIFLIEIDGFREMNEKKGIREAELYKFSVSNIAKEIITENLNCEVFRYQQNKLVLLANYDNHYSNIENLRKINELAEEIRTSIKKFLEITVTVAIGGLYPNICDVFYSFTDAQEALAHKLYLGGDCVISAKDINLTSKKSIQYPTLLEEDLISAVKIGAVDQIDALLDAFLLGIMNQKNMPPHLFRKTIRELIVVLFRMTYGLADEKNHPMWDFDYFMEFEQLKTMDQIKSWLKSRIKDITKLIQDERKSQSQKDIDKAKQYIYKHYNEQISLQKVADYVCMSPTYFSAVFKDHVGKTFIEFLKDYRMEKAKELLLSKQYKVYEVANKVGYSDRRYFSDLFKKHTGLNPGSFVEQYENHKNPPH